MLEGCFTVLVCLAAGETLRRVTGVPVSGPVIGMALMVALLTVRGGPSAAVEQTCGVLLRWLPLLFVPAGLGIVQYLGALQHQLAAIGAALVVSTALAMAVSAWTMQAVMRWRMTREGAESQSMARE